MSVVRLVMLRSLWSSGCSSLLSLSEEFRILRTHKSSRCSSLASLDNDSNEVAKRCLASWRSSPNSQ